MPITSIRPPAQTVQAGRLRPPISLVPTLRGPMGLPGSSGDEVNFSTLTLAQSSMIAAGAIFVRTAGALAVGDGGAALYKRSLLEPSHPGKFQSADGAWWEISDFILFPESFGGGRGGIVAALATAAAIKATGVVISKAITFDNAGRISIPSGVEVVVNADLTNLSRSSAAGMFNVQHGARDILISGTGAIRGPYTQDEPVPTADYPNCNGAIAIGGIDPAVRTTSVRIDGPPITGWGTYGVFAENVDDLYVGGKSTKLVKIGRDGIRTYGCRRPKCGWGLHIENIHPGLSGNVYGITFTRRLVDGALPTSDFEAIGGTVDGCYIWKGIDTHGGQGGLILDWVIRNCSTPIGLAEGDTTGLNDFPRRFVFVDGIVASRGTGTAGRAAINIVGSGPLAAERAVGIKIGRRCSFDGFGGNNTGAIEVAWADVDIDFPTLINCNRAGVSFKPGPVSGRAGVNVENLTGNVVAAISVETAEANLDLLGGLFRQTAGTFRAFSLVSSAAGYAVRMHDGFKFEGDITKWANTGHIARLAPDSPVLSRRHASCNTTGATGIAGASFGIASVSRTAAGVYVYTLAQPLTNSDCAFAQILVPGSGNRYGNATIDSATQITVRTFNTSSSFVPADADHRLLVSCP